MAIEIKIPKEIKDYKETFLFGLTVKKFVSLAIALLICVPLYVFGKNFMPEEMVSWAVILVGAPILGVGFITYHNMTFTQLARRFFDMTFHPQRRKYTELPVFWYARQQAIEDILLAERERKKIYLAEKKKRGIDVRKFNKYIFLSESRKGARV
ncbi:MAG: PrgI family protein [Eubacterium sp.]|nr:PrgI family protein [Eubacterium sp.]